MNLKQHGAMENAATPTKRKEKRNRMEISEREKKSLHVRALIFKPFSGGDAANCNTRVRITHTDTYALQLPNELLYRFELVCEHLRLLHLLTIAEHLY